MLASAFFDRKKKDAQCFDLLVIKHIMFNNKKTYRMSLWIAIVAVLVNPV